MSGSKSQLLKSFANSSFIDTDTAVTGNLNCEGDLVVAGSVKGDGKVRGVLTLLESGRWDGNIETANALLAGQVQGNILITEKLEIRKSARILGSLRARTIAVAEGAIIDGEMAVAGDAPIIRFEEKRKED